MTMISETGTPASHPAARFGSRVRAGWQSGASEAGGGRPAPLAACRQGFAATAGFSFLINLLVLILPLYSLQVFDRVLGTGSGETLAYLTLIALIGLALLCWLDFIRAAILQRLGLWLEQRLAPESLLASLGHPGRSQAAGPQLLRDIALVRNFIGGSAVASLCDAPWVPVYLAALWLLHPLLGATVLAAAAVLLALALLSELATRRPLAAAGRLAMEALGQAEAAERQREAAAVLGMAPALVGGWAARNEQSLRLQTIAGSRAKATLAASKFCVLAAQVLVLGLAAWLTVRHEITGGAMIAASILLSRALAPIEQVIASWRGLAAARAAWGRVAAHLAEAAAQAQRRSPGVPCPEGRLTVEQASVAAGANTGLVLRGISLALAPGRALAVLGPSGAGKSTLMRAVVGALPALAGSVRLDGADVFTWDRTDFARHVGYLPQDIALFEGTVRETIGRTAEADPEEVVAAARRAGVHELVLRLPQGYETRLGEQGVVLPAGQRRRIALARALFGRPCLVVLDEPDANLDGEGLESLLRAIAEVKARGAAVVVVTNRPNLLRIADDLLILRNGMVEQLGPRDAVAPHLIRPHAAAPAATPVPAAPVPAVPVAAQAAG